MTIAMSNQVVSVIDSFFVNFNPYQGISSVAKIRTDLKTQSACLENQSHIERDLYEESYN